MGFDAGSITGHLNLTRDEWDEALEEVKVQGAELEESPIEVAVTMVTDDFMEGAELVQEIKDELGTPINVDISLDDAEFDAEAADAILAIEAIRAAAAEPIELGPAGGALDDVAELQAAVDDLANTFEEIGQAADRAGGRGLVTSLLDAGLGESELLTALRGMGFGKSEAQTLVADARLAADQAATEAAALRATVLTTYMEGLLGALADQPLALGPGTSGGALSELVDANWSSLIASLGRELNYTPDWAQVLAELPVGERLALTQGSGGGALSELGTPFASSQNWAFGTREFTWIRQAQAGSQAALPAGPQAGISDAADVLTARIINNAEDEFYTAFAEHVAAQARIANRVPGQGFASILLNDGLNRTGAIGAMVRELGVDADEAEAAVDAALADLVPDVEGAGDDTASLFERLSTGIDRWLFNIGTAIAGIEHVLSGGTGGIGGVLSKMLSGDGGGGIIGSFSSAVDDIGPEFLDSFTDMLAPALVPILGALGGALGGAIAGTSIGGAGFLDAMIPGILDLSKGYDAYAARKALAANPTTTSAATTLKGLPAGALGVGTAIGNLLSGGSGALSGLETGIYPDIERFLNSLTAALPALAPFFETAVTEMSRFFNVIDNGLTSSGFKSFMATMTKDLGPIMTDFGKVIEHLGTAFGGFLTLFGGTVAQRVGSWFVRVTTDLSNFLSTVHFGPGFVTAITTVFHDLGSIFHTIWTTIKLVADAAAPVGLAILGSIAKVFTVLAGVLKDIPVTVLTGFIAAFVGVLALTKAAGIIRGIGGALSTLVANPEIAVLAGSIYLLVQALKTLHDLNPDKVPWKNLETVVTLALHPPKNPTVAQKRALTFVYTKQHIPRGTLQYLNHLKHIRATKVTITLTGGTQEGQSTNDHQAQVNRTLHPNTGLGQLNTQGWLTASLGHTVNAFIRAWEKIDNDFIHPLVHGFTTTIPHAFEGIGNYFTSAWGDVETNAVSGWHTIYNGVFHPLITFFTKTLPGAFEDIGGYFAAGWGDIENTAVSVWHTLYNSVFHPLTQFFTKTLPGAFENIGSFFVNAWNTLKNGAVSGWHTVYDNVLHPLTQFFTVTLPHAFSDIGGFFSNAWGTIETDGVNAWHNLYNNLLHPLTQFFTVTIPHGFTVVINFFETLPTKLKTAAAHLGSALLTAGKDLINGLINGVDDAINWVNNHIPSVFGIKIFPSIPDIPDIRATGGPVGPGQTYLVGEKGPELLQFGATGMISPNSTLRSLGTGPSAGSGGNVVYITVDARGATNPGAVQRAATSGINATLPRLRAALERGAA